METKKFKTVDEYISSFPAREKSFLQEMRKTIKEAAPLAEEVISYNMPAYKYYGILVYFAAHQHHMGFYPANSTLINSMKDELTAYECSKGTIKFPFEKKLPIALIRRIVKQRAKDNLEKAKSKKK